jgi:hypothetical protein
MGYNKTVYGILNKMIMYIYILYPKTTFFSPNKSRSKHMAMDENLGTNGATQLVLFLRFPSQNGSF